MSSVFIMTSMFIVPSMFVITTISMLTISILVTICSVLTMGRHIRLSLVMFSGGGALGFFFHGVSLKNLVDCDRN
jgi:hypothetical protein